MQPHEFNNSDATLDEIAQPPHRVDHNGDPPSASSVADSKTGRILGIGAGILAIGLGAGFFIVHHRRSEQADQLRDETELQDKSIPMVDVMKVAYANPTQAVTYPGEARGWFESTIYARVNGYVSDWTADIGDHIKKGQVLATIETPDLDAQLVAAQHQLSIAQSEVDVTRANTDFAKSTYDRWKNSPPGVVSVQEQEEKKEEFTSSVAKLKAADSKVSAEQANVEGIVAIESYKNVTAPFDGVIMSRRIDIGNLVTAGSTASTSPLYTVAQINKIRVFVDVPQRAIAGIEPGVAVTAYANEFPDRKFVGKVTRSSHSIDPASRTLHVEVDFDNPDQLLMPGMYLEMSFGLSRKGLLKVPASALLFKPTGPQVAVVDDSGTIKFRDVNIAIDNGDSVELSSGVHNGDSVALNLSNQISEGEKVEATNVDQPAMPPSKQSSADASSSDGKLATAAAH